MVLSPISVLERLFQNARDRWYLHLYPGITIKRSWRPSNILGCLTFVEGNKNNVLYKGIRIFTDSRQIKEVPLSRICELIGEINFDGLDYIVKKTFKFIFQPANIDIVDGAGDTICRGTSVEMKNFLFFHKMEAWQKIEEVNSRALDLKLDSKYVYNPTETEKVLGVFIPESKPPAGYGLAPDFSSFPNYLYNNGIKKIKMSGIRYQDELRANKALGLTKTPDDYVWHHLDDFDPVRGECTMQLVRKDVHATIRVGSLKGQIQPLDEVIQAGHHVGGVALWKHFYNVLYK